MTQHLEDLLTIVTRDRARVYARLDRAYTLFDDARAEADILRAERDAARLDLAVARELLAYHDLTPVDSGGE